jgi:hypothetical protein
MIKASAAAGAAAWTAPVIIDSLSSPAAAVSGGLCGCHFLIFNNQCSPDNQGTPCNTVTGCTKSALVASCLTITPAVPGNCQSNSMVTISVNASCRPDCTLTKAESKSGDLCSDGTRVDAFTVTFPAISSPGYAQFDAFLTCAGASCP